MAFDGLMWSSVWTMRLLLERSLEWRLAQYVKVPLHQGHPHPGDSIIGGLQRGGPRPAIRDRARYLGDYIEL